MIVWTNRICSPLEHGLVDAVDAERVGVGDPAHLVVLAVDVVHPGNLGRQGQRFSMQMNHIRQQISSWAIIRSFV